jgi:hypothetical protein
MYFVVLPDGQKFGPADVRLLNQWISEGRVLSTTVLEDAQTGQRLTAGTVPGLTVAQAAPSPQFPPAGMSAPPPANYSHYPRGGAISGADNGQNDLTLAYVFAAIGLVMCLGGGFMCSVVGIVFPILGLVYAKKAEDKGNPSANSAKILSWIALALQIAGMILGGAVFGFGLLDRF